MQECVSTTECSGRIIIILCALEQQQQQLVTVTHLQQRSVTLVAPQLGVLGGRWHCVGEALVVRMGGEWVYALVTVRVWPSMATSTKWQSRSCFGVAVMITCVHFGLPARARTNAHCVVCAVLCTTPLQACYTKSTSCCHLCSLSCTSLGTINATTLDPPFSKP